MFKDHKGEIVSVLTPLGEIIGRLVKTTDINVEIKSPRLFVSADNGVGFAPGISMTGVQNPDLTIIPATSIISVVRTHEEIARAWQAQTSGIILS